MFPEELDIIESQLIEDESVEWNGTTYLYDFKKGDFIYRNGKLIPVVGIEALRVWIEKVIRTEKFTFTIYDGETQYGVLIDDLFGSGLERYLIESELQREITEALLINPFITDVDEWVFEYEKDKVYITFSVVSDFENFNFEVVM